MNLLSRLGFASAAAVEKHVGDLLTVTITMTNPEPVHMLGFTVRAPEVLELEWSSWGDGLPIADDSDIKETAPDAQYCEWSLTPDTPPIPAGTHTVAVLRYRCTAPVEAAIVLEDFIAATYSGGAPLQYEADVEQAPAVTVVMQTTGGRVAVKVSVS